MTNILGPYYAPHHHYQQDRDYVRALDPAWVRIHQPDALSVHEMTECAPNANIMLRSWDIDDSNGERKREMYADPKGAAKKHLEMWRAKWDEIVAELRRNGWAYDTNRWYLGLVNEPDPAYVPQVVEYSLEAMRLVQGTQIRLGLVCSSVGTFSKPSENGDGWAKFPPLEKPINDGGHILIVHEYWQPEGPSFVWEQDGEVKNDAGNLAWRHRSIPLDVPILIGESGANGYIYGRHTSEDNGGWRKYMSPEQYAAQVAEYIRGCDKRVKGVLLYMLDYHSDQWESFYTGPAAQQLLTIKGATPQVPSPYDKTDTYLPSVPNGNPQPPTVTKVDPFNARVVVPSGANIRTMPNVETGVIVEAVPYGDEVTVSGSVKAADGSQWALVRYGDKVGWMRSDLLSAESEDAPQGDNWSRAWPVVLRFEGGLSLDPNDPGNYYQGKLVGTKYGISAAVWGGQYDIPNLTQEQALDIYRKHYWEASGADQLPWPMALIVFDTAVNHGTGVAKDLLTYEPTTEESYLGQRALRYFNDPNWQRYGVAWGNRVKRLHKTA